MSASNIADYGIIGPGSIGLLWAVKLRAAHSVALWGRSGPMGLSLEFMQGETISESFTFEPRGRAPGTALVTTKAYDTVRALDGAIKRWRQPPRAIVLFQNGVGSQDEVQQRFDHIPLLAVSTTEGANRTADGALVHAGSGLTRLGPLNASGAVWAEKIGADFCAAGFDTRLETDIRIALWEKLLINAGINAFTVLLDCPNGALRGHSFFEAQLPPLCYELAVVSQASGYPASAEIIEARIRTVAEKTAGNISSMLQDVRSGRPTEINVINGAVVRAGITLGIATPVNRMLADAVAARTR
ncbi:MAG: 2-dehydropantoate 2-reductase [Alteromonadaceae bacterium]|nr:2-dehydropantoate 2-reductase [Alteromonadaceae bacterium]